MQSIFQFTKNMANNVKGCFCLSSRTVATFLALLGITVGSTAVIVYATGFGIKDIALTAIQEHENESKIRFEQGQLSEDEYDYAAKFYDGLKNMYPYILLTGLITGIFYLVINIMMLWGVRRNNSWLIIPWLVTTMVGLISQTAGMFCIAIYIALNGHIFDSLLYTMLYCPLFLIGLYLWLVVNSVYCDIRKETTNAFGLRTMENNSTARNQQQTIRDTDPPPPYSSIQGTKDDK